MQDAWVAVYAAYTHLSVAAGASCQTVERAVWLANAVSVILPAVIAMHKDSTDTTDSQVPKKRPENDRKVESGKKGPGDNRARGRAASNVLSSTARHGCPSYPEFRPTVCDFDSLGWARNA